MNILKTALLRAALTALFGAVGYAVGGEGGMFIALAIAAATNAFAYWNSDRLAPRSRSTTRRLPTWSVW